MFNRGAYENSRPDGIGVLEIVAAEDKPRRFVPLKRTELKGEIAGPLAALRLVQTFGYSREQSDKVLEAVYRFPLPGDAAVTGVLVRFGDVEIRAELKERQQAEADYEAAKREGRQAALATRESPDVFTLQVAGLKPDEDILVETAYVQLARVEGANWTLRVPLTTAPRYVRSDETGSRQAQGQPLALLRDPGHRFALDLVLKNSGGVESPTHALETVPDGDGLRVRLRDGEVLPDRDCVLLWRAAQEERRPGLHVLLHEDTASKQIYFLALVTPPARRGPDPGVPREAVLLVDHSGSMQGAKWAAADWAVTRFLSGLNARDAFALGLFHTTTHWFDSTPHPADPDTVGKAVGFLQQNQDSGGTELGVALEQALGLPRAPGERARNVLIVTDAEVTDAGRILRLASEEAGRSDRRRISVLCIDAAPNSFLAGELAERGGGVARFLTSAPEEEDISTALDEVLEDWSEPILANLHLEVNRPGVQGAGREAVRANISGGSALDLGDLPMGRAVWAAGRVPRGGSPELIFRVTNAQGKEAAVCRLDLTSADAGHPALKALFGARRVLGLEYLISSGYSGQDLSEQVARLGYDPKVVLAGPKKVYAENTRADATNSLRPLLVSEALDYGLASSETAFLAVRTEAGNVVEGTVAVANALPAGWSDSFVAVGGAAPMAFMAAAPSQPFVSRAFSGGAAPTPPVSAPGRLFRFKRSAAPAAPASPPPAAAASYAPPASGAYQVKEVAPNLSEPLFAGVPRFADGEAVLFDSAAAGSAGKLPEAGVLSRLEVRFPDGTPELDSSLVLLLYVDDLSSPRAKVRLADLMRQGGARPLNVRRGNGQVVRVVLQDSAGTWAGSAPRLEVMLV